MKRFCFLALLFTKAVFAHVHPTSEYLAQFAGVYKVNCMVFVDIKVGDGVLTAKASGMPEYELTPLESDEGLFVVTDHPNFFLRFKRAETGVIDAAVLSVPGTNPGDVAYYEGTRIS